MNRRQTILRSVRENPEVPVLILGGGVNGTGLLRELALQGVDCLLVDKSDFVAGASSKSSRMIHGGLRYLENREFRLVRESLFERNRLLQNAPHCVAPLKTTIPLFSYFGGLARSALIFSGISVRPGSRGVVPVKVGLAFYDFVTRNDRRTPTHFITSRDESLRDIPGLNPHIAATATYWDAWITQAERLCIELIQDARAANPNCRAINYVRPRGIEGGAVVLEDQTTGETVPVRPQVLVNATGGWVDITNETLGLIFDTVSAAVKGVAEVGGDVTTAARSSVLGVIRGTKDVATGSTEAISAAAEAAVKAVGDVGGDMASAAKGAVEGAIQGAKEVGVSAEEAASAAASGAIKGAGKVSSTAVEQVRNVVTGTISGVKVVLREPFKGDKEK